MFGICRQQFDILNFSKACLFKVFINCGLVCHIIKLNSKHLTLFFQKIGANAFIVSLKEKQTQQSLIGSDW